jgi:hypothetical protein
MPDPVLIIRGFPPLFDQPSGGMLDDLKAIASLSDKQVQDVRQRLAEDQRFLDPKTLLAAIHDVLQNRDLAEAVRRAIQNLERPDVKRIVASLKKDLDDNKAHLDQATIDRLEHVLSELIHPYPGLVRFQKAERLAKITGQHVETVELVCDLRPIFDSSRANVEGMMPYTRLRIVTTGEEGLPKSFEAELTDEQVLDLADKAEKAKSKLKVLRQSIETWLPGCLPDLPLTRPPQKESGDA